METKSKGGPKTNEGKAVSRYNAIKHGLLSKEVLLDGEDEKALVDIGKKLRSELQPQSELEAESSFRKNVRFIRFNQKTENKARNKDKMLFLEENTVFKVK
jgi:hypothetical protein